MERRGQERREGWRAANEDRGRDRREPEKTGKAELVQLNRGV